MFWRYFAGVGVSAGVGAAAPVTVKPAVKAKGTVSGRVGIGLTKAQQVEAALVGKLPGDFPIDQWESMNTKAQLKAMQHSGLNDQEQWVLLNATAPLSVLDQHNRVQDEIETRASATRIAATLMNVAAQATATAKAQAAVRKPTISTSLQNNNSNGQLWRAIDAFAANLKSAPSSKDAFEQKNGTISAKVGGVVSAKIRNGDQSPSPLPTPNPNPPPSPTPNPNENPLAGTRTFAGHVWG